mmetsp:Transcript_20916/g.54014  ORF Transcript_20916/g.54014 Transcript_20916/m.54014 type:complete len:899 (+) Transcript_20916:124-2820(+)
MSSPEAGVGITGVRVTTPYGLDKDIAFVEGGGQGDKESDEEHVKAMRFFFPPPASPWLRQASNTSTGAGGRKGNEADLKPFMRHYDVLVKIQPSTVKKGNQKSSKASETQYGGGNVLPALTPGRTSSTAPQDDQPKLPQNQLDTHFPHTRWKRLSVSPEEYDVKTMYFVEKTFVVDRVASAMGLYKRDPKGKIDFDDLQEWLREVRPPTKLDALPLFYLLQNVLGAIVDGKVKHDHHEDLKRQSVSILEAKRVQKEASQSAGNVDLTKASETIDGLLKKIAHLEGVVSSQEDTIATKDVALKEAKKSAVETEEKVKWLQEELDSTQKQLQSMKNVAAAFKKTSNMYKEEIEAHKGRIQNAANGTHELQKLLEAERGLSKNVEGERASLEFRRNRHFCSAIAALLSHPIFSAIIYMSEDATFAGTEEKKIMRRQSSLTSGSIHDVKKAKFVESMLESAFAGDIGTFPSSEEMLNILIPHKMEESKEVNVEELESLGEEMDLIRGSLSLANDLIYLALRTIAAFTTSRALYVGEYTRPDGPEADFIGQATLDLDVVPLQDPGKVHMQDFDLDLVNQVGEYRGKVKVSIGRQRSGDDMQLLNVHIADARDLPAMDLVRLKRKVGDDIGACDPEVHVTVGGLTLKTDVKHDARVAVFDEMFEFELPQAPDKILGGKLITIRCFDNDEDDGELISSGAISYTNAYPQSQSFLLKVSHGQDDASVVKKILEDRQPVFVEDVSSSEMRYFREDFRVAAENGKKPQGQYYGCPIILRDPFDGTTFVHSKYGALPPPMEKVEGSFFGVLGVDTIMMDDDGTFPSSLDEKDRQFIEFVANLLGIGLGIFDRAKLAAAEVSLRDLEGLSEEDRSIRKAAKNVFYLEGLKKRADDAMEMLARELVSELKS